jgi:hypothetical protein
MAQMNVKRSRAVGNSMGKNIPPFLIWHVAWFRIKFTEKGGS